MFIVTAKEMYDIDHYTKHDIGFGDLLMENAGRAACNKILEKVNKTDSMLIFAGTGNNGGDGYVIARTFLNLGYHVLVLQVGSDEKLTEETSFHKQLYVTCGGTLRHYGEDTNLAALLARYPVVVDAMLGLGVKGLLREPFSSLVTELNQHSNLIISIDLPTGLPAEESDNHFKALEADHTIVIGAAKMSTFLESTSSYYGEWDVVNIGHPPSAFKKYAHREVWTRENVKMAMPKREIYSHKGDYGRGLIVGGSDYMPGSLAMAARSAVKSGAGLITAATTTKVIDRVAGLTPEVMYMELDDKNGYLTAENDISIQHFDALAIGVGLGRTKGAKALFEKIISATHCPIVVDADGLYHLKGYLKVIRQISTPVVLTPHPGEMANLLDISVAELKKAPFTYAQEFAEKYHVYVILKGHFTIITSPHGKQAVNTTGNPGLAKGGSGDVLTGVVLASIMQEMDMFHALCHACFVHGYAADLQVKENHSYYDLSAMDVIEGLPMVYRTLS